MDTTLIVLLFRVFLTSKASSIIQNSNYWTRINVKFKQGYVMDEYKARTLLSCLVGCSEKDGCLSVTWSTVMDVDRNCLLSAVDQTNDDSDEPLPIEVEDEAGWKTLTRIRYPVAHVLGVNGRYTLTFEEANNTCVERGTEIAAPEDLLAARSMGYEFCSWGWLADGRIGLVIQKEDTPCLSWYTDGLFICNYCDRVDVWCKI